MDGDYLVDILWRNANHGGNAVWYMSEDKFFGDMSWLPNAAVGWEMVGTGELNGDGELDLLWRNPATGQNAVWYMDNATIQSIAWLPFGDVNWDLIGSGGFE